MSNDFYDISAKMKKLFPPNPQGDLAALQQMASNSQESMQPEQNFLQESVDVTPGSMPIDKDYSVTDFAALAGIRINESQKTGPAGQLKAKDNINIQPAGTTGNPTQDRLVGEEGIEVIPRTDSPAQKPDFGPSSGSSAQIEDLAARISKIEAWIEGRIKGTMRKVEGKSPHKKGTPKYKKHMAAMHAEESTQKSSIKEELFRKLAASRK